MLADAVVAFHLAVVAFIVGGGLLAWRRRRLAFVHLPFAAWGIAIEIGGWTCPLTPLENWLRRQGGEPGYRGGFVEHYVLPVLYPAMGRGTALALAALVLTVNAAVYVPLLVSAIRRGRRGGRAPERTREGPRASVPTP